MTDVKRKHNAGPKRKGKVYCSKWCGGGCTWEAFKKAERRSQAMADKLGPGWTPRVWENLGWHWSVTSPCGRWRIHANYYRGKLDGYTAFLGEAGDIGGRWAESGKTAEEAMQATYKVAVAHLKEVVACVPDWEAALLPDRAAS